MGNLEENENERVRIEVDNTEITLSTNPIIKNGYTLVPMRAILEKLGAEVTWDERAKTAIAEKDRVLVKLKINSYFAQVNGETVQLPVQPILVDGKTMIPLRFVSEAFGASVDWDGATRTVQINTTPATTIEDAEVEVMDGDESNLLDNSMSLEEAIELAKKHSYQLTNLEYNIERWEELRSQASDNLKYTPIGFGGTQEDLQALHALRGLAQADTQLQMAKRQLEIAEEGLSFQVESLFNNILTKQNEIALKEKEIKHLEQQLQLAKVKLENGIESEFNIELSQTTLKETKLALEKLNQELRDTYIQLNALIGLPDESDIYPISHEVELEWLEEIDLDNHIRRLIQQNPIIWLKEQEIEVAQMGVDLYVFNVGDEPYKVKEINVQTAKNELANLKLDIDSNTRSRYNQMQQLQTQYAILETNLAKAKQALDLVRAQYDAGMAIDLQLREAELAVDQLESQKLNIAIAYEQLKTLFYKPWLAGN